MMKLRYKLKIEDSLSPFRTEIEYVLSILERYYPLQRDDRSKDELPELFYGSGESSPDVNIPAVLFEKFIEIDRTTQGVSLKPGAVSELLNRGTGLLPANPSRGDNRGKIDYDAIGLAFFMLSRIEERNCSNLDKYGRFPASQAFSVRAGLHSLPLADLALDDIAKRLLLRESPQHNSDYLVIPTHDVDMLKPYHMIHQPLRYALGDFLKRGHPVKGLKRLASYGLNEPKNSFNRLMSLSEKYNLTSRFYFMGPSNHKMDSSYSNRYPELTKNMAEEVKSRGHIVGFHPGYMTFDDPNEWSRQKRDLEKIIQMPVKEGRQHVLRYDCDQTHKIWSDEGMSVDHTLAFPDISGFRSGSTRPYPAFDLTARGPLNNDICSTAVMEFCLFGNKYRDLTIEEALDEVKPLIVACRRYGGKFVILQHTGNASKIVKRFYENIIEEAA
tara:strand:- start:55417 stop:56742 length:1326 start_codon:yes stop_codon:yes gene_type:complete